MHTSVKFYALNFQAIAEKTGENFRMIFLNTSTDNRMIFCDFKEVLMFCRTHVVFLNVFLTVYLSVLLFPFTVSVLIAVLFAVYGTSVMLSQ